MMRSWRLLFVALFLFFLALRARAQPSLPPNYFPIAPSYVVVDLDSGRVLSEKNSDARLFPASTTKIMTALVAAQNGDLNGVVRASKNAASTGESSIYLLEGENLALADLIRAALIRSANDSCVAIAEGVAGSQSQFVEMMNAKAKELGLKNTHFVNPHGLHDANHFTSARDLAIIGREVTQIGFLNQVMRAPSVTIPANWKSGGPRIFPNRNKLLKQWKACDGMKTGYTRQAGHCLVATATKTLPNGKKWRLLSVVMKSSGQFTYFDSQWLLQRAFADFAPQTLASPHQTLWSGAIRGGAFPLEAQTTRGVRLPVAKNETVTRKIAVFNPSAPVKRGQIVGRLTYFSNAKTIASLPLVARGDVPQTLLARTTGRLGESVSFWSLSKKIGVFGALLALWATLLTRKRLKKARRKGKRHAPQPFRPVNPRDL